MDAGKPQHRRVFDGDRPPLADDVEVQRARVVVHERLPMRQVVDVPVRREGLRVDPAMPGIDDEGVAALAFAYLGEIALDARADKLYDEGTEAKTNDDRHILSTVFFAAVLFLAAVSLRLEWKPLRIAVLAFGAVMFLGSLAFVLTLPTAT